MALSAGLSLCRRDRNGEEDVDEEVGTTTTLEEDTDGREDDGKDDLADVAEEDVSICRDASLLRQYSQQLEMTIL
ncbi:unnamed protein product [Fusarium graminearum]|uniref:Uncharacterized protein n=1 Tax=Gibberella zeae TaxID=5518 RepID=A0A4E9DJV0_GIBZA|nr:unnamed protein product [Fusarium graminearum]CAF3562493.1 unnamed protein product [Fusarium graminearum]CAG1973561.1 unnamed protein product [Fusarium graminearum]CAG1998354.1 unnamed protein product [Fusarium graminearum]